MKCCHLFDEGRANAGSPDEMLPLGTAWPGPWLLSYFASFIISG